VKAFKKALLEAVLEEYIGLDQQSAVCKDVSQKDNSVWLDQEHRCLYLTRQDHCMQYLFLNQEQRDAYIRLLQEQGYQLKKDQ